jgi:hypothetical protein
MTLPELTPAQERFLAQLFKLCDSFKSAGIVCSSNGVVESAYEINVRIQLPHSGQASTEKS